MIAHETLYYSRRLAALYNKSSTAEHTEGEEGKKETANITHKLAQMITYIEETKTDNTV